MNREPHPAHPEAAPSGFGSHDAPSGIVNVLCLVTFGLVIFFAGICVLLTGCQSAEP